MSKFTLTEDNAADIARQTVAANAPIALVAVEYNWGPPISGRFDSDYLHVWAAARTDLRPRAVRFLSNQICYSEPQIWVDEPLFDLVRECGKHTLYYMSCSSGFATEFVIKMVTDDGQCYYDNNGGFGINYRIVPFSGRGASAVACDRIIWRFSGTVSFSLLGPKS